ncbi:unnamed protein product [Tuber aestivum]|uniref:Large ribosomal subunit protein uL23m n=1 Tax=Tuber aestivum TaxID=59557 RepID=A0A292Q9X2_9PEZI|nr:unnamed protein product [Tuber aestivum]
MPLGTKKVFLPNLTLALVRTPHLPPNYAQFIVPLNINKLDLKDYLLHVYNVEVLSVRSFVQQQKIQRAKNKDLSRAKIEWYRPRAIKKMTVELKEPFVYPPEPEDLSPWDHQLYHALAKQRDKEGENNPLRQPQKPAALLRKRLRVQAEELFAKNSGIETIEVEKELSV